MLIKTNKKSDFVVCRIYKDKELVDYSSTRLNTIIAVPGGYKVDVDENEFVGCAYELKDVAKREVIVEGKVGVSESVSQRSKVKSK